MKQAEIDYRKGSDEVWDIIGKKFEDHMNCGVFSEEFFFEEIYPIKKEDLYGANVLDGGCGCGRCTSHCSKYANFVTGIDLAYETLLAAKQKDRFSNCIYADLSVLPVKDNAFDIIYSFGVLHHTPSPKKSFMNLVKALKPGGKILVWVYSKEGNAIMLYFIEPLKRVLLNRFPNRLVWVLSYPVAAVKWLLIHIFYLPVKKYRLLAFLKSILPKYELMVFWGESRTFRWMFASVFDLLTAPIAHYHSRKEVVEWTEDAGLVEVEIIDRNGSVWKVYGKKSQNTILD